MYIDLEALSIFLFFIFLISAIRSKEWWILWMLFGGVLFLGLMIFIDKQLGAEVVLIFVAILFVTFMIISDRQAKKEVERERQRRQNQN